MDKCRLACDISQEDAHLTAFPEDNKVDEDILHEDSEDPSQLAEDTNAVKSNTSHDRGNSSSNSNNMLQAQQPLHRKTNTNQRYNLRNR